MHIAYSPYSQKISKCSSRYFRSINVFWLYLRVGFFYFDHDAFTHHALHVLNAVASFTCHGGILEYYKKTRNVHVAAIAAIFISHCIQSAHDDLFNNNLQFEKMNILHSKCLSEYRHAHTHTHTHTHTNCLNPSLRFSILSLLLSSSLSRFNLSLTFFLELKYPESASVWLMP